MGDKTKNNLLVSFVTVHNTNSFENETKTTKFNGSYNDFSIYSKAFLDNVNKYSSLNTIKNDALIEQYPFFKNVSPGNIVKDKKLKNFEVLSIKLNSDVPQFTTYNKQFEEVNFLAVAVYSFKTNVDGDLSFRRGDILFVTRVIDESWYKGSCASDNYKKVGIFPKIFVKSLKDDVKNIYDLILTFES